MKKTKRGYVMKIEIFKDKQGSYRARIKSPNGKIIWVTSESYMQKRSVEKAVELLGYLPVAFEVDYIKE